MKKKYMLEGIDPDLWREFKAACVFYNTSMRDNFIVHMLRTVDIYKKDRGIFDKPKIYTKKGGKKR